MAKKMGRPKIEIDWEQAEKLAQIQCTGEEIAHVLGFSYDTLVRRISETYEKTFAEWYKSNSDKGKMSLRRWQMESARKGNAAMQIWLGKQYLGQKDKQEVFDNRTKKSLDDIEKQLEQMMGQNWIARIKKSS